ncbi:hypothetical protein J7T55_005796 [Diaporthe amygdali]|uniref:uncharacterized protein n=1 Tax=Phomopsis amygdali TaxID=1214568 RepID=UPI0022FE6EEE|nr:uncharacterized protein J7T55_005796 [Diaporthe amygdali]KAJ0124458.1 hypothetical protein J7T55_005796 [Diaporthe amygdali]
MQSADHIVVGSPSPRHSHKQQYNDDFLTGRNVGRYGVPPRNVLVFYVLLYSLHRPQILYDSGRRRWVGRFGAVRPGFKAGATEALAADMSLTFDSGTAARRNGGLDALDTSLAGATRRQTHR